MITPLHHSDYTLKNRAFNCRMRNRYYEEVYYAFRAILPTDRNGNIDGSAMDLPWFNNLKQEIKRLDRLLMTCLEYSQAAVFYGKADIATLYSKDKRPGEEEIRRYFGTLSMDDFYERIGQGELPLQDIHRFITGGSSLPKEPSRNSRTFSSTSPIGSR